MTNEQKIMALGQCISAVERMMPKYPCNEAIIVCDSVEVLKRHLTYLQNRNAVNYINTQQEE
jgi:hypothetical protein